MKKIEPPYTLSDFNLDDKLFDDNEAVCEIISAIDFILKKIEAIEASLYVIKEKSNEKNI